VNAAEQSFAAQLERARTGEPGFLAGLRAAGRDAFLSARLPTPKHEDWRFTNLAPLGAQAFAPASPARASGELPPAPRLVLANGRLDPAATDLSGLPAGVRVGSLAAALRERPGALAPLLGQIAPAPGHAFAALNAALFEDGALVVLRAGGDEPAHAHPVQWWTSPYVSDTHAAALRTGTDWGVNPNVLNVSDETLRFYENVLTEVLEVFPSGYVHLGGDECPKDQWRASAAAQARMKELGLPDEEALQSWFIRHFDSWLAARGRRLIGWDEILQGGLAPGAAVSSWRGYAGGVAAARAGHRVVMCPEQQVYLDHRESDHPDEPVPVGWVRTLEDVYRFEPIPPELRADPAAAGLVMGAQANIWTEFMDDARSVDYHAFPRLAAFAEVAWSRTLPAEPESRDAAWADFERRMAVHYRRLDALGVEYRPPEGPRPWHRRPGVRGRPIEGPPPAR
jgi:hypothetical protein